MKPITAAIVFGLAGLVLGAIGSTYAWLMFVETGDRNRTLSSAELQLQTLGNLRDRDVDTALKIQEKMLSTSIISLGMLLTKDAGDREAEVLLGRIKSYRQANPHKARSAASADEIARAFSLLE